MFTLTSCDGACGVLIWKYRVRLATCPFNLCLCVLQLQPLALTGHINPPTSCHICVINEGHRWQNVGKNSFFHLCSFCWQGRWKVDGCVHVRSGMVRSECKSMQCQRVPPHVVKNPPAAQHAYINGNRHGGKKEWADKQISMALTGLSITCLYSSC